MTPNEDPESREIIRKAALLNAIGHGGKARTQSVLGKVLAECPYLRDKVKQMASVVADVVGEINNLTMEQQRIIVEKRGPRL